MSDNAFTIPLVALIVSILLGLFAPSPLPRPISNRLCLYIILLSAILGILAFGIALGGSRDWAIMVGVAAESVFMLCVWLTADKETNRRRRAKEHTDWQQFDDLRSQWAQNGGNESSPNR